MVSCLILQDASLASKGVIVMFSEYWNCFPMCAYLHRNFIGKRFEPGEHKLEAVRIYYLKHSGIVVKMDVKEAPR